MMTARYLRLRKTITLAAGVLTIITTSGGCIALQSIENLGEEIFGLQTRVHALENKLSTHEKGARDQQSQSSQTQQLTASQGVQLGRLESDLGRMAGKVSQMEKMIGSDSLGSGAGQEAWLESSSLAEEMTQIRQDYFALKESLAFSLEGMEKSLTELSARITELSEQSGQIKYALDDHVAKSHEPKKSASPSSSAPAKPSLKSLMEAREAFGKKQYLRLAGEIPGLMGKMSKDSSKEELRYYLCESLYKLGNLEDAVMACDRFLKLSPTKASYISRAKLRLGDSYRHLGKLEVSRLYYEDVIREFPNSQDAVSAQRRKK